MRAKLSELADANGRSMTAEVVAALDKHLKGVDRLTEISDFIEDHKESIEGLAELWEKVEKIERMVYDHDERFNPMKYDRD